jgi:hypothetical protein
MQTFARKIWVYAMNRICDTVPAPVEVIANPAAEASGLARCGQSSASAVDCPAYLRNLNSGQRAAVEYSVPDATGLPHLGTTPHHCGRQDSSNTASWMSPVPNIVGPLLVIAGAGAGKTNPLAQRVAHLILMGTLPERILLLTFSSRAEMTSQAQHILAAARGCVKGQSSEPVGEIAGPAPSTRLVPACSANTPTAFRTGSSMIRRT